MMPLTLSPLLVLADADGDAAVVAGMASAIPAASAPVTFDFMVSPGIAGTAHDRGAAHPSHPREILAWILACRGCGPLARVGLPYGAVLIGWCLATAARRALGVPTTCRRPFLCSRKGPLSAEVRSWRLHRHTTVTPAELARWIDPIVHGWMSYYGRFYRSAPYPLLSRINHYMMR